MNYSQYFKPIDIRYFLPFTKIKFRIGHKFYSSENMFFLEIENKILFSTQRHHNNLKNKYFIHSFKAQDIWHYMKIKPSYYFKTQYDIISIVGYYKHKDCLVFCNRPEPRLIAKLAKEDYDFAIIKMMTFAPYMTQNEAESVVKLAKLAHKGRQDAWIDF